MASELATLFSMCFRAVMSALSAKLRGAQELDVQRKGPYGGPLSVGRDEQAAREYLCFLSCVALDIYGTMDGSEKAPTVAQKLQGCAGGWFPRPHSGVLTAECYLERGEDLRGPAGPERFGVGGA